jgi:hypothetical protein
MDEQKNTNEFTGELTVRPELYHRKNMGLNPVEIGKKRRFKYLIDERM